MIHNIALVVLTLQMGAVQPVGEPDSTKTSKGIKAYRAAEQGLRIEVRGPTRVLLELYAPRTMRNTTHEVTILRNEKFRSQNTVKFRGRRGGPKGYAARAIVGFEAPTGTHTYQIATKGDVWIAVSEPRKLSKRSLATAEEELSSEPAPEKQALSTPAVESAPSETAMAASSTAPAGETNEEAVQGATASLTAVQQSLQTPDGMDLNAPSAAQATATPSLAVAKRVAVYQLELQGIEPSIGAVVTDSLLGEVRKLQGVAAIGMDEIRDMLSHEANKQVLGCEESESCLAEIAGALGVDDLITGKLSKVGDQHVILIRRIDQRRAKVTGVVDRRLKAESGQEFLLAIGPAVEELFPERGLKPGTERGVSQEVALRLNPPPLPKWSFYAAAGGAVAALALGGVFGALANSKESEYRRTIRTAQETGASIDGAELNSVGDSAESHALGANVSYGVAGGLAITSAIIALFTDWWGYADQQP